MAKKPLTLLTDFVSLQRGLWAALINTCNASPDTDLESIPMSGALHFAGAAWTFQRHGLGILFVEDRGKRKVDIHAVTAGPDSVDPWRLATYLGGLGREGEKLITRAIGRAAGTMDDRVKTWFEQLEKDGTLVREGNFYRLRSAES